MLIWKPVAHPTKIEKAKWKGTDLAKFRCFSHFLAWKKGEIRRYVSLCSVPRLILDMNKIWSTCLSILERLC
jgi:hypothetical protein